MTNDQIKQETLACYLQIQDAEHRLTELRRRCKHEKTTNKPYQWRTGSTFVANVCDYCGDVVPTQYSTWAVPY